MINKEMERRDQLIKELYYTDNYSYAAIGRVFNLDRSTVLRICGKEDRTSVDFNNSIHCPVTGDEYVHISGEPVLVKGNDNYEANWGGKGDAIFVPLFSENGFRWDMIIGEHKGRVYIGTRNIRPNSEID